jgi:hypothetical protein
MKTKMFLVAACIGLSLSVLSVQAAADRTADEQQIRKIEQEWVDAIAKRDGAFLTKLEAEENLSGQYSWMDAFVTQNGQWKAVAAHLRMVEPAPTP